MLRYAAAAVIAGITAAAAVAQPSGNLPLKTVADVALTGRATRLDYQSIDLARRLLFIAHLGDSAVIVIDLNRRRVVATIPGISRVHGVLAVPQEHVAYASATGTNEIVAIDERKLAITARIPGGVYPDGIAYEPRTRRLFVSDEHGRTETVIDTLTDRRLATIPLGGQVGNTQFDSASGHVFVNVQTSGELVEIDPATLRVIRRTRLGSQCARNHGLLIDAARNRAFIACEDNAKMVLLDLQTRRIVDAWSVGDDPDVLAADFATRRLYVAAESGIVAAFSIVGPSVEPISSGFLATAAHSVAVDPLTGDVYFPLQDVDGRPVLRITKPAFIRPWRQP